MLDLIQITGIVGLFLILLAFALNLFHVLSQRSLRYNILNIVGSAILSYYAVKLNSIPFLILQLAWMILSLIKLGIVIKKDKLKR